MHALSTTKSGSIECHQYQPDHPRFITLTYKDNAEFLPGPTLRATQIENWQLQRKRLVLSEFYKEHHQAAPVNFPTDIAGLEAIAFTDKEMLRANQRIHPPFGSYLATSLENVIRLHRTSGTTGQAMNLALSAADTQLQAHIAGRSQAAAGLGSRDIVIHCLNYQMWMGGLTDHLGLETTGAVVVPFGVGDSERLVQTILDVGINAISCTPSYPARLEHVIQKKFAGLKPKDLGLRKGFMGGEAGLDDLTFRHRLEETWGMRVMNSNYGVSDVLCNFAGQCTEQNDLHFLALDVIFPELVNPDSLERLPWETDREGELVLTNLYKECQPLVRFRTGDLVRLTSTEICLCGRTAPRFRVIGRIDDMVTVRGVNVFPSTLSSAVHSQIELNGQYRVRLRKPPPYDQLPLEVELEKGVSNSNLVSKDLTQAIGKALRITVDLTLLKPGVLFRIDGKTQRVIKEYES